MSTLDYCQTHHGMCDPEFARAPGAPWAPDTMEGNRSPVTRQTRARAGKAALAVFAAVLSVTLWTLATNAARARATITIRPTPWVTRCTPGEAATLATTPARCVNLVGTRITLTYVSGRLAYHGVS